MLLTLKISLLGSNSMVSWSLFCDFLPGDWLRKPIPAPECRFLNPPVKSLGAPRGLISNHPLPRTI